MSILVLKLGEYIEEMVYDYDYVIAHSIVEVCYTDREIEYVRPKYFLCDKLNVHVGVWLVRRIYILLFPSVP